MSRKIRWGFWAFLLLSLAGSPRLFSKNSHADLVLIHGHILTVDANDSVAQALAIRNGAIVKVGYGAMRRKITPNKPRIRGMSA